MSATAPETSTLPRYDGGERLIAEFHQPANALLETAQFAAVAHRAPHLHGKFRNDLVVLRSHHVEEGMHAGLALRERDRRPVVLGLSRLHKGDRDLRAGRDWTPSHFAAVDR
jgi:hypothetical protein